MIGVVSNTKWEELRLAMYSLSPLHPRFQVKDRDSEAPAAWDGEWFYHFREISYDSIEWVDIQASTTEQRAVIRECLCTIRVPAVETGVGFRVFGWIAPDISVDYFT